MTEPLEKARAFVPIAEVLGEVVGVGIERQILAHSNALMLCRVRFDAGAVGTIHSHPHSQISYVESGRFRFVIEGVSRDMGPGDSCVITANLVHGTQCLEGGVLLDVFQPAREDFLPQAKEKL